MWSIKNNMILALLLRSELKLMLYFFVVVQLPQWNDISNMGGFGFFFA